MPTSTASHQPQSAGSDVFNVHENVMLHAAETWAMTVAALNPLWLNVA